MKTVRSIRGLALTGVAALGLIAMTPALADSDFQQANNGTLTAEAELDFEIVIPRFLYLQVGSADTNVNVVDFDLSTGVTVRLGRRQVEQIDAWQRVLIAALAAEEGNAE